ncbi:hypothetical protein FOA43_000977 [Brettanomyces nanus]|uniref:Uncharacterized protein n=1 Tax=Eeniella nana TaxID=13502 RepID=A0A875S2V5_EENNA|nr:uncharacterized protein FOA43_000977 [Brettanomyces nanus]QPG73664.1 hypothetical protein FOA43_000977 [Brettanomyces nanus]
MHSVSIHPATNLSKRVGEDVKKQFLTTPPALLIENPAYSSILSKLRNDYKFCYLVQWLYVLKHLIRMGEAFDVENLEEEVIGIADPPVFLDSFKVKLIQYLSNYKINSVSDEFSGCVDQIFGSEMEYDTLGLEDKVDILYQLVLRANKKSPDHFRKILSRYDDQEEEMRVTPLLQVSNGDTREEYLMLKDARLYYRKWEFVKMSVPKKRKDYLKEIEEPEYIYFDNIEPKVVEWKCLAAGIYQFDRYTQDLKASAGRKKKSISYRLASRLDSCYDRVIAHDLRKRKQALQRKKEVKMQFMLAHRKRSSRLMEREEHRKEQEARRHADQERLEAEAADRRVERRRKMKEKQYALASMGSRSQTKTRSSSPVYDAQTREERELKRQKVQAVILNGGEIKQEENWQVLIYSMRMIKTSFTMPTFIPYNPHKE